MISNCLFFDNTIFVQFYSSEIHHSFSHSPILIKLTTNAHRRSSKIFPTPPNSGLVRINSKSLLKNWIGFNAALHNWWMPCTPTDFHTAFLVVSSTKGDFRMLPTTGILMVERIPAMTAYVIPTFSTVWYQEFTSPWKSFDLSLLTGLGAMVVRHKKHLQAQYGILSTVWQFWSTQFDNSLEGYPFSTADLLKWEQGQDFLRIRLFLPSLCPIMIIPYLKTLCLHAILVSFRRFHIVLLRPVSFSDPSSTPQWSDWCSLPPTNLTTITIIDNRQYLVRSNKSLNEYSKELFLANLAKISSIPLKYNALFGQNHTRILLVDWDGGWVMIDGGLFGWLIDWWVVEVDHWWEICKKMLLGSKHGMIINISTRPS